MAAARAAGLDAVGETVEAQEGRGGGVLARVVAPVLDGWSRGLRPLEEYDAGSPGPPR